MLVARRTFLLGVAALIASPAIAKYEKFTGPVSTGELRKLPYRAIARISISCAPRAEDMKGPLDLVQLTLMRNDEVKQVDAFHPLNGWIWVGLPGEEKEVRDGDTFRVLLEPCYTLTSIYLSSNIEPDRTQRPRFISESYRWTDGKPTLEAATAASYRDADTVARLFKPRDKGGLAAKG